MKNYENFDYLEIIINEIPQKNIKHQDGTTSFGKDKLIFDIEKELNITLLKENSYYKDIYKTENSSIYFIIENGRKKIQFKAMFFLDENWKDELKKYIEILKQKEWHLTRIDYQETYQTTKKLEKIDKYESNLQRIEYSKKSKIGYIKYKNTNFDFVIYDKSAQIKTIKNEEYIKKFKLKFESLENLKREEIRLKNKKPLIKITKLLKDENYEEIKKELQKEKNKRIKIRKKNENKED